MRNTRIYQLLQERPALTVGLIFLIALGLRLTNLSASSLWIDEIYSLIVGNTHLFPDKLDVAIHPVHYFYERFLSWQPMDWNRLITLLKINVHMPLYYLLLNPWLHLFGNDAIGLRSFSAFFSALMIVPVYWLGLAMAGKRAGYLAALVTALVPFQIYYGQEGRMYALSLFWTVLAGFTFWKTLFSEKPARWGWLYAIAVSGGMLSHYMFVFFLGFQFFYGLVWLFKNQDFKRLAHFLPALFALTGIALGWLPVYQLQQQGVNEEYHFAKGLVGWNRYLTVPLWQPLVVIAGDNKFLRIFYFPVTVLLFLYYAFIPKGKTGHWQLKREGYLLSWIIIPLFLQIGYDLIKETHISIIDRYAMLVSPAMCLWLGLALNRLLGNAQDERQSSSDSLQKSPQKLGGWILAGMSLLALANVWSPSPFRDEHNKDNDIRGKFQYFAKHARPGDLILTNGPLGAPNIAAYYLQASMPNQPIVYWISEFRGLPVALPSTALIEPYQRVWLFRYRANNERGLQTAKDYLQGLYPHLKKTEDWFIYSR